MSDVDTDRLALCSPADFAAMVPVLVGFQPEESLVLVALRDDQVVVSMRLDLGTGSEEMINRTSMLLDRVEADDALIAVCTNRGVGDQLPYLNVIRCLIETFERRGVGVRDALLIDAGRFWSYICDSAECCDASGVVYDTEAHMEFTSSVVSRRDIEERYELRPDGESSEQMVALALERCQVAVSERAERVWLALNALAGQTSGDSDEARGQSRALIQVGMQDVRVRDYCLARLAREDDAAPIAEALVDCALSSREVHRSRMCGAAAAALAATESSTVPASCLLAHAGGDSLAALVRRGIEIGVSPTQIREILVSSLPMVMGQFAESAAVGVA